MQLFRATEEFLQTSTTGVRKNYKITQPVIQRIKRDLRRKKSYIPSKLSIHLCTFPWFQYEIKYKKGKTMFIYVVSMLCCKKSRWATRLENKCRLIPFVRLITELKLLLHCTAHARILCSSVYINMSKRATQVFSCGSRYLAVSYYRMCNLKIINSGKFFS